MLWQREGAHDASVLPFGTDSISCRPARPARRTAAAGGDAEQPSAAPASGGPAARKKRGGSEVLGREGRRIARKTIITVNVITMKSLAMIMRMMVVVVTKKRTTTI